MLTGCSMFRKWFPCLIRFMYMTYLRLTESLSFPGLFGDCAGRWTYGRQGTKVEQKQFLCRQLKWHFTVQRLKHDALTIRIDHGSQASAHIV